MEYLTAVQTDLGIKKETNQDAALIKEAITDKGNVILGVLCDGMGGLEKGELASTAVIKAFSKWFEEVLPDILYKELSPNIIKESWNNLVDDVNEKIETYGANKHINLGTTLVCVLLIEGKYYVYNIGDSRAYLLSNHISQLTHDHTYVQMELDAGRMTREEMEVDEKRNILLQCIGVSKTIQPDFFVGECFDNSVFLLCSDGFRHKISDEEIYENLNAGCIIDEQKGNQALRYLIKVIKDRDEQDNITAVLIKILGDKNA